MRTLIVGCGYVGLPLGASLARQGHEVFGLRRGRGSEAALKAAGLQPIFADVTRAEDLADLPRDYDWVVNTISSSHGGAEDYRQVYLQGTRNLIDWLAPAPPKKYVYTSSTGVYGQNDGSMVDESTPPGPQTETGRVLLETEQWLLAAARTRGFPAVILRLAGIYGPGRGHYFKQFLNHQAALADGGQRVLNMIHRDDVGGAIQAALERGRPGEIYNATDDEPVTQWEFFRWLADKLGRALPLPSAPAENASPKRGRTSKLVSNRKLKTDLGYLFKYPTFREGYAEEVRRAASRSGAESGPE